jgi:hypothetical protein
VGVTVGDNVGEGVGLGVPAVPLGVGDGVGELVGDGVASGVCSVSKDVLAKPPDNAFHVKPNVSTKSGLEAKFTAPTLPSWDSVLLPQEYNVPFFFKATAKRIPAPT